MAFIETHIVQQPPHRIVQKRFLDISNQINGNIEFGSPIRGPVNIRCFPVTMTSPGVANTEFTITHNLGYIPAMLASSPDIPAHIYASRRNQWTATQAFFKADQANVPFTGFIF